MNHRLFLISLLLCSSITLGNSLDSSPIRVVESGPSFVVKPDNAVVASATSSSGGELVMLLERIQAMHQEILQLRGLVEEQEQALQRLSRENRDRYIDLDSRISALQKENKGGHLPSMNPQKSKKVSVNQPSFVEDQASSAENQVPSTENQEKLYQNALSLVKARRFSEAIEKFKSYLSRYPEGELIGNSYYWLGEIFLVEGESEKAKSAFEKVLSEHPDNPKASDATYKLGRVMGRMGDVQAEKEFMNKVISQFPQSAAAKLADTYLRNVVD